MSIDVQVLRKNLASGIQQHIQRINYCYQVAFIPGMQVCFNFQKAVSLIHHSRRLMKRKRVTVREQPRNPCGEGNTLHLDCTSIDSSSDVLCDFARCHY